MFEITDPFSFSDKLTNVRMFEITDLRNNSPNVRINKPKFVFRLTNPHFHEQPLGIYELLSLLALDYEIFYHELEL